MTPLKPALAGALGMALAFGLLTACDLSRAVDCTRLALEVSSSVEALEQSLESGDPEAFVEAADTVTGDVEELRNEVDDTDVAAAADSVVEAVDSIRSGVENGTEVDVSPLGDATAELTDVCTS